MTDSTHPEKETRFSLNISPARISLSLNSLSSVFAVVVMDPFALWMMASGLGFESSYTVTAMDTQTAIINTCTIPTIIAILNQIAFFFAGTGRGRGLFCGVPQ